MDKKRIKAYILLLSASAIWGIAGPVIKVTVGYIPPFTFLTYRLGLSVLISLPWLIKEIKKHKLGPKDWRLLILLGFLSIPLCLGLLFEGIKRTTVLEFSILTTSIPILITVGGIIFLHEEVTKRERLGLVLALAGSLVVILVPVFGNHQAAKIGNLEGNLLLFGAYLAWTAFILLEKYKKHQYSPLLITLVAFLVGLIFILPLSLIEQKGLFNVYRLIASLPLGAHLGVWYMTIFSGLIAYYCYNLGVELIEASEASLFTYLQPLFAAPLALWWLGEKITPAFLLGSLIITLGVFLSEWRSAPPPNIE